MTPAALIWLPGGAWAAARPLTVLIWLAGATGVVLSLGGNVPAIRDALSGKFAPQVLSWTGWAAIMVIGGGGTWRASPASAAYILACAGGCLSVAVLSLRVPKDQRQPPTMIRLPGGRRARLDLVCLPGATAGLTLLLVVRDPAWAVGVSVATDAILYVPTAADGWRDPHRQPLMAYAFYGGGAAAAGVAVAFKTPGTAAALFTALAYPVYLVLSDGGMSVMLVAHRRTAPKPVPPLEPMPEAGPDPGPVSVWYYDSAAAEQAAELLWAVRPHAVPRPPLEPAPLIAATPGRNLMNGTNNNVGEG